MKQLFFIAALTATSSSVFAASPLNILGQAVQPNGSILRGDQAFADLKKAFPVGSFQGAGGIPSASGKFQTGPCGVATAYATDGNEVTISLSMFGQSHACVLNRNDPKLQEDILDPTYTMFGNSDNTQNHPDPHGCRVALTSGSFYMVDFDARLMAVCRPNS